MIEKASLPEILVYSTDLAPNLMLSECLLSTHTMSGTILRVMHTVVNNSCHHRNYILCDCPQVLG